jgi:hypothetical protein
LIEEWYDIFTCDSRVTVKQRLFHAQLNYANFTKAAR